VKTVDSRKNEETERELTQLGRKFEIGILCQK